MKKKIALESEWDYRKVADALSLYLGEKGYASYSSIGEDKRHCVVEMSKGEAILSALLYSDYDKKKANILSWVLEYFRPEDKAIALKLKPSLLEKGEELVRKVLIERNLECPRPLIIRVIAAHNSYIDVSAHIKLSPEKLEAIIQKIKQEKENQTLPQYHKSAEEQKQDTKSLEGIAEETTAAEKSPISAAAAMREPTLRSKRDRRHYVKERARKKRWYEANKKKISEKAGAYNEFKKPVSGTKAITEAYQRELAHYCSLLFDDIAKILEKDYPEKPDIYKLADLNPPLAKAISNRSHGLRLIKEGKMRKATD